MIRFGVLGPVQADRDGSPLPGLSAHMVRQLLGALLTRAGDVVPVEELMCALWGDDSPPTARKTLQVYVRRLRAALGSGLVDLDSAGYRLRLAGHELDAHEFSRLVTDARQAPKPAAAELLERALALWRGPAYEDVREHSPIAEEARRLDEERLRVEAEHVQLLLDLGRHEEVVSRLLGLTASHPYREDFRGQLMLALYRSGRQSEALELFRGTRKMLDEELGIAPGPALQRLHEAILRASPELDLSPPINVPRQLPIEIHGFVGRNEQLRSLDDAFYAGAKVLLVSGLAGVGKTALAVKWAHQRAKDYPDGQIYLNLNGFSASPPVRPIEALASMLRGLGVPPDQVPAEAAEAGALLRSLLAELRMLLVLDNARSVEQVRPLLPGGPGCLAVVTSRNSLSGLLVDEGARRVDLDVLPAAEARQLLGAVLRARVTAEPDAADRLAQLCSYLPLALRVVAANLVGRPHRTLGDHIAELDDSSRNSSLQMFDDELGQVRSMFDLSVAGLDASFRRTFGLIGLIPGREVSVDEVAAMTGQPTRSAARQLQGLANSHLVELVGDRRFGMHDLLRRYAADVARQSEPADELAAAAERLLDWYWRRSDAAAKVLYPDLLRFRPGGSGAIFESRAEALAWLEQTVPNLVAAMKHYAGEPQRHWVGLLADALRGYGTARMPAGEWHPAAAAAVEAASAAADPRGLAFAYLGLAHAYRTTGSLPGAARYLRLGAEVARESGWYELERVCTNNLGGIYMDLGDLDEAAALTRAALEQALLTGNRRGEAACVSNLGFVALMGGRLPKARKLLVQGSRIRDELGDVAAHAFVLNNLGLAEMGLGNVDAAEATFARAMAVVREVRDLKGLVSSLSRVSAVYLETGRSSEALDSAGRALTLARETGDRILETRALCALGFVQVRLNHLDAAAALFQSGLELASSLGAPYPELEARLSIATVDRMRGQLDEAKAAAIAVHEAARDKGFGLLEVRACGLVAAIEMDADNGAAAAEWAWQALGLHQRTGLYWGEVEVRNILAKWGESPSA